VSGDIKNKFCTLPLFRISFLFPGVTFRFLGVVKSRSVALSAKEETCHSHHFHKSSNTYTVIYMLLNKCKVHIGEMLKKCVSVCLFVCFCFVFAFVFLQVYELSHKQWR